MTMNVTATANYVGNARRVNARLASARVSAPAGCRVLDVDCESRGRVFASRPSEPVPGMTVRF